MKSRKGGVLGKQITLIKGDAPTAEAAKTETERMINVEKLKLIMGTYSSSLSFVASAVADKSQVIYSKPGPSPIPSPSGG